MPSIIQTVYFAVVQRRDFGHFSVQRHSLRRCTTAKFRSVIYNFFTVVYILWGWRIFARSVYWGNRIICESMYTHFRWFVRSVSRSLVFAGVRSMDRLAVNSVIRLSVRWLGSSFAGFPLVRSFALRVFSVFAPLV